MVFYRRVLEHYRRLLFEPVSVPILDDDSQQLLDESYDSYSATYSRGVNPGRLTPQDCIEHCQKVYYNNHALIGILYIDLFQAVFTNTKTGVCINEVI